MAVHSMTASIVSAIETSTCCPWPVRWRWKSAARTAEVAWAATAKSAWETGSGTRGAPPPRGGCGRAPRAAVRSQLDEAELGVDDRRIGPTLRRGTGLAVAADGADDQLRPLGPQHGRIEAHAGHHPGAEVLDHHVGVTGQLRRDAL